MRLTGPMADKRADQTVPLVIYKGGERIVIGQAIVKGDGGIEGQIAKDVRQELKDLLFGGSLGALSLDPKPNPDLKYNNIITSKEAQTIVAIVPPGDGITEIQES